MTKAQLKVEQALSECAYTKPECKPSQEWLAIRTGYTRQYVNKICRELRNLGRIEWRRERRPGSRWEHNVYTLNNWSPPLRKRSAANCRWIREIRAELTLREPQRPVRAQTPTSFLHRRKKLGSDHCGREAKIGIGMKSAGKCRDGMKMDEAQGLAAKLALLEQLCADYESEKEQMVDVIDGLHKQARQHAAKNTDLERQLAAALRAVDGEVQDREIRAVIDCWIDAFGKSRGRIVWKPAGKREKLVRQALKLKHEDGSRVTTAHLCAAIKGKALKPWRGNKGWARDEYPGATYDDRLEMCIGSEDLIERNREIWEQAQHHSALEWATDRDAVWREYQRLTAQAHLLFDLCMGPYLRAEAEMEDVERSVVSDRLAA